MNKKVLETLEFNKIIDMLCAKAISPMGKELCQKIKPLTDIDKIKKMQSETSEMLYLINKNSSPPLEGLKDIRNILLRLKKKGVLSCTELMDIADFLNITNKIKTYSNNYSGNLKHLFDKISPNNDLKLDIESKINFGEVVDNASKMLWNIRREIFKLNSEVKQSLNQIIRNSRNILQDSSIYIKNSRFCLAVKSEYKNSFNGVIHDQSSSGLTLFMEPTLILDLNNKIKKLKIDEQKEIIIILSELSNKVSTFYNSLSQSLYAVSQLDFIFARAQLAISMKSTEPVLNNNGYVNLKQARHPLINSNEVVPLDVCIGDKFKILVITGPNTGGKTVSLKTVGLLVVMAQAGLHIPAVEGSTINIFTDVFVDIGDEQSIEQNLSTFSAHIKNVNQILNNANKDSLVLLDELGAGTDPIEGAALAVAILKSFLDKKLCAIVTSHYSELKLFAMTTHGVENASCEFDLATLKPTYRLLIGIPGKSNAFEIAERIGVDKKIIDIAKQNIKNRDIFFEDTIKNINDDKLQAEKNKIRAEQTLLKVLEDKKRFELEFEELKKIKQRELDIAREKANKIIRSAEEKSKLLIKYYRENKFKDAEELRTEIKSENKRLAYEQDQNLKSKEVISSVGKFKVGDSVFSVSLNKIGIIESLCDQYSFVSIGNFKVKLPISDLKYVDTNTIDKSNKAVDIIYKQQKNYVNKSFINKSMDISSQIDVHGCTCDEATSVIDKYIDDALIAQLEKITVIHGKGTGALRAAIWNYLKDNKSVKSFRPGGFGEGGIGVTIIFLR